MRHLAKIPTLALLLFPLVARGATTTPATRPTTQPATKFLRFVDDGHGGGKLESAITTYRNSAGVVVHLVAAVHVGDKAYYDALSQQFATYDALLFEMVKPKDMPVPPPDAKAHNAVGGLQRWLKNSLELQYQLDVIDYTAPNFIHADLTYEEFTQLQSERGESIFGLMLKSMLDGANNASSNAPELTLADLLRAMNSPDRSRQYKLLLARQFDDIEAAVSGLTGPNGSVLVTERNKAAIKALDAAMTNGKRDIGIFYGAAHMPDLSTRLTRDKGFKQTGVEWRVAWDMTAPPSTQPATKPTTRPTTN